MLQAQASVSSNYSMEEPNELLDDLHHSYQYTALEPAVSDVLDSTQPISVLGVQLNLLAEDKAAEQEMKVLKAQKTSMDKKRLAPLLNTSTKFNLWTPTKLMKRKLETIEIEEPYKRRRIQPAQEHTPSPAQATPPPAAQATPPPAEPATPTIQPATPSAEASSQISNPVASGSAQPSDPIQVSEDEAEPMEGVETDESVEEVEEDQPMELEEDLAKETPSSDYGDEGIDYSTVDLTFLDKN